VLATWDLTLPTLAAGVENAGLLGVRVANASFSPEPARLELLDDEGRVLGATSANLGPLETRQLALAPDAPLRPGEPGTLALRLRLRGAGDAVLAEHPLELAVHAAGALGVRTFRSAIDASVQKYALLPPADTREPSAPMRLLLSLHGAGVDCESQAASYAPKPDFWIAAPTNRRPFGFDWQDWGRRDAYEALDQALAVSGVARERVVLSGHSMGGHGAWHLASTEPDGFAAVAPSAGCRSFDTYGSRPQGALRALWLAADGASRTKNFLSNLVSLPIYVLHGEADDNVPASAGHAMVDALTGLGTPPESHFEPGAGHWWDDASGAPGAACLDWPGFFELFRRAEIPAAPEELDWRGIDLALDARHSWVGVEELLEYGRPFHVHARLDAEHARLVIATQNVRLLALDPIGGAREAELDGATLALEAAPGQRFLRGERWQPAAPADRAEKRPAQNGPLKRAFERGFVLVVPTAGSAAENAASLARARHDQGQWAYRANGDAPIVTDEAWLADPVLRGRNPILYGNETTNAAFARVVPEGFPLRVLRGKVRLGAEEWSEPGLGALAVGPARDDPDALFAILGASDVAADRAAACLSLFVSGAGFPDFIVYGPDVLARGDGGVRGGLPRPRLAPAGRAERDGPLTRALLPAKPALPFPPMSVARITTAAELEAALAAERFLLFKHSTRCPVSADAFAEYRAFTAAHPEVASGWIDVIEERPLSRAVAERTGIRHESPQAILLEHGTPGWNASHAAIRQASLESALALRARG
jgi:bacillithiol system protein YtxJ